MWTTWWRNLAFGVIAALRGWPWYLIVKHITTKKKRLEIYKWIAVFYLLGCTHLEKRREANNPRPNLMKIWASSDFVFLGNNRRKPLPENIKPLPENIVYTSVWSSSRNLYLSNVCFRIRAYENLVPGHRGFASGILPHRADFLRCFRYNVVSSTLSFQAHFFATRTM